MLIVHGRDPERFLFNILFALKKFASVPEDRIQCLRVWCAWVRVVWWELHIALKSTPQQQPFSTRSLCLLGKILDWKNKSFSCQIPLISSSSSSSSNLVLSDECLTRMARSEVRETYGVFFSESLGSFCPSFLFYRNRWPDRMMGM